MAARASFRTGSNGKMYSLCLSHEGLPAILWDILRPLGYKQAPMYIAKEFDDYKLRRCHMSVTVVPPPEQPEWDTIEVEVNGCRLEDSCEAAAMGALMKLSHRHPEIASKYGFVDDDTTMAGGSSSGGRVTASRCVANVCKFQALNYGNMNYMAQALKVEEKVMLEIRSDALKLSLENDAKDRKLAARDAHVQELVNQSMDKDAQVAGLEQQLVNTQMYIQGQDEYIGELNAVIQDYDNQLNQQWQQMDAIPLQAIPPEVNPNPQEGNGEGISGLDAEYIPPGVPFDGNPASPAESVASVNMRGYF